MMRSKSLWHPLSGTHYQAWAIGNTPKLIAVCGSSGVFVYFISREGDQCVLKTEQSSRQIDQAYRTLGLETDASLATVKVAYRDLVKVWHPDRFPNDRRLQEKVQEKLKGINLAYAAVTAYIAHDRFDDAEEHSRRAAEDFQAQAQAQAAAQARAQAQAQARAYYEFRAKQQARPAPPPRPRTASVNPAVVSASYELFFRVAKILAVILTFNLVRLFLIHCGAE